MQSFSYSHQEDLKLKQDKKEQPYINRAPINRIILHQNKMNMKLFDIELKGIVQICNPYLDLHIKKII